MYGKKLYYYGKQKGDKMNINKLSKRFLLFIIISAIVLSIAFTGCGMRLEDTAGEGIFEEKEAMLLQEAPEMEMAAEDSAMEKDRAYSDEEYNSEVQYSDIPATLDRKVIKTAYMELEIEKGKFEKIIFNITRLAENNGGFISHTQSYSDVDGNLISGSITIRIPQDKYNSALDLVKEMGMVKSISVSGQDITQEYTDLESRLRNMEAQEEILLDLMAQSKNVSDSIDVQRELSHVQEQIEVIKGRINYMDNMVSFSTIDIYLYEPEPITSSSGWGFLKALKQGLRGAVTVFNTILVFVIASSPIFIFIVIILLIIWLIIRSRRRRRARIEKK